MQNVKLVLSQPVVQPTKEKIFDPSLNHFTACFYSHMICRQGGGESQCKMEAVQPAVSLWKA